MLLKYIEGPGIVVTSHYVACSKQPLHVLGRLALNYHFLILHSCGSLQHWVCPIRYLRNQIEWYLFYSVSMLYSYGLPLETIHSDFKSGLEGLLKEKPTKAIFIGTRIGDPNAVIFFYHCSFVVNNPLHLLYAMIMPMVFPVPYSFGISLNFE